ncbi:MAG: hypothetical protein KKE62_06150 [Proteobacteria bacterium]|nr:hypothetical protein [Pseudomonadota bacterium]MBU1542410.1 hypothetical protein [Pseudomonadota bacterium]MBU2430029.1 hypothetical protein [Pseudomonadota bacterium]MBU2482786.1 hypothetical protein [Pseudomonadota bacterium]
MRIHYLQHVPFENLGIVERGGSMNQGDLKKIQKRMIELEVLISETKKRLPAHSIKPPIMLDLLEYEDEYDLLLQKLNGLKKGE